MRFNPRVAVAALVFLSSAAVAQTAPVKIAYVDVQALIDAAPGHTAAESAFKKESDAINVQFGKLQDSAKVLEDRYAADEAKLTAVEKDKRQKAIVDFEQGVLPAKRDEFQGRLEKLKADLMAPIQLLVKQVLEDLRKAGGYSIIFDNSPSGGLPIAVADKNLDITDEAKLKLLQKADGTVKRGGGGGTSENVAPNGRGGSGGSPLQ